MADYDYIPLNTLTPLELRDLASLRVISAAIRDSEPEELTEYLSSYISVDTEIDNLSTNQVAALIVQAMQVAYESDEVEEAKIYFSEDIPMANSLLGQSEIDPNSQQNFAGYNFGGNCDCDTICDGFNALSDCWAECYCDSDPYAGEDGTGWTIGGSTIGGIFSGIFDGVVSLGNSIGWDNIWNSLTNTADDGSSDDAPDVDITIVNEDDDTSWGKVALYVGLGIVVIVGGFFIYKKIKKS